MYSNILELEKNITFRKGRTSKSFTAPFIFVKYVIHKRKQQVYQREKYICSILKKFDWCPKLLYSDDKNKILIFNNVGVPVTSENKPKDFKKQFNKILSDMKSVNVQHNDIGREEILVDNQGKVHLCDFGWASVNERMGCGIGIWDCHNKDKPGGYVDDANTLSRLGL